MSDQRTQDTQTISLEQHCRDLGELEQIISELRRALDNANAALVAQDRQFACGEAEAVSQDVLRAKLTALSFVLTGNDKTWQKQTATQMVETFKKNLAEDAPQEGKEATK